jgi:AmmeMemoRadiSam system protein A
MSAAGHRLDDEHGHALVGYARETIRQALGGPPAARPQGAWCEERHGAFVTLHRRGALHGCIGAIEPRQAVADVVGRNAVSAALMDPRATELTLAEVDDLDVEVSVLSPISEIAFDDEASALAALVPHEDGVVLRWGRFQGIFLPQVWASLPEPRDFLDHLKIKAGLPTSFWEPDVKLLRFHVTHWEEKAGAPRRPRRASA